MADDNRRDTSRLPSELFESAVQRYPTSPEFEIEFSSCTPLLCRLYDPPREAWKLHCETSGGAIAQLVERLNGIQEVRGSTPLGSTNKIKRLDEK